MVLSIDLFNMFWAHYERSEMLSALIVHQTNSIAALAQINNSLASGISKQAESQNQKDETLFALDLLPTPTPRVITKKGKTKTRTRYIHSTPTPFKLFGP
jgi:3-methyladenine DNA glycosylase/8-oxoguanine DNA glycosylase